LDLHQSLKRVDDAVGDLYRRAVDALDEEPSVAALVVACHCLREIANNLVDLLDDVQGLPSYEDSSKHSRGLAATWTKHEDVVGPPDRPLDWPASSGDGMPEPLVTIPADLLEAARRVVHAHQVASANSQQRRSALVMGTIGDGDHGSVRVVKQSLDFFMRYTHLRKNSAITLPGREDVEVHLSHIEGALLGRVGDFFTRVDEVRHLLARANRKTIASEEPK
jgi:hypothetical protein